MRADRISARCAAHTGSERASEESTGLPSWTARVQVPEPSRDRP